MLSGNSSGKSHSGHNRENELLLKAVCAALQERKEDCAKMKETLERLDSAQKDFQDVSLALESERYRAERLEEQINDLTELHQVIFHAHDRHLFFEFFVFVFFTLFSYIFCIISLRTQNEIENLKQALADMEEKVQYQSDERLRDVNEVLENCQTRVRNYIHLFQHHFFFVASYHLLINTNFYCILDCR